MAYICYKPKGSCKTCEHYRYDDEESRYACFAAIDNKNSKKEHSDARKLSDIKKSIRKSR